MKVVEEERKKSAEKHLLEIEKVRIDEENKR